MAILVSPTASAQSPAIRWEPVEGVLGNTIPRFHVETGGPLFVGGFWVLETEAQVTPTDDPRDDVTWREPAVWSSLAGTDWIREPLPHEMLGRLTLVAWQDAPAVIELRYLEDRAGIDLRVWTRQEGIGWTRVGRLRTRPTRSLRGCGFTNQQVAATREVIAITASCQLPFGAGGDAAPAERGLASVGGAMVAASAGIPVYTWTTTDGRDWARHRVLTSPETIPRAWIADFQAVGNGIAAVTYGEADGSGGRLRWSADGSRFEVVADLPEPELDTVEGLGAILDEEGAPRTWLLLADHIQHGPDHEPAPGSGLTLWRLDPGEPWAPVLLIGPRAGGALAIEGEHVVVLSTQRISDVEETVRVETSTSGDAGRSFIRAPDSTELQECSLGVAVRTGTGVLSCSGNGGQGLRSTPLWAPAGSS